jgi:Kelch motif
MTIAPQSARHLAATLQSIAIPLLLLTACTSPQPPRQISASAQAADLQIPPLPIALSNNAVASVRMGTATRLYSFMGLGAGKTHADIVRAAFEYDTARAVWQRLPDVPVSEGRLASVAAAANGAVYLFGGYSVAADGHEVSTPDVLRFDPAARAYRRVAPMPSPVDDSVALVLDDRWIYLVSGWHQDRNLPLVQVYDTVENRWTQATEFPGAPVFGHAGALLGRSMLICDGVRLDEIAGKRTFSASPECLRGEIAQGDRFNIAWRRVAPHPGGPRYRMAAAADAQSGRLLFAGGSENPYNYNGIGYDGRPSPASARVQAYDLANERWQDLAPLPQASMDHRGLAAIGGRYALIGGMRDGQRLSAEVMTYAAVPASTPAP